MLNDAVNISVYNIRPYDERYGRGMKRINYILRYTIARSARKKIE